MKLNVPNWEYRFQFDTPVNRLFRYMNYLETHTIEFYKINEVLIGIMM